MSENKEKPCMTCKKTSCKKSSLMENGTVFSMVNHRPNAKFHFNAITKRHTEDLRGLTDQEWADILPVLKDGINKIEAYYQHQGKPGPLGYRISIPVGELAGHNIPPHFYARIVPKYKKDWGKIGTKRDLGLPVTAPEAVKFREILQPNQDGVVLEKNKTVARMIGDLNFISISTKAHLSNDIQALDQATWNEIGQMLQELMKKAESKDACHDFNMRIELGKEAVKVWKEETGIPSTYDYSDSELVVNLFPINEAHKQLRWWLPEEREKKEGGAFAGTFEHERLAFKLNNPKEYARIWDKQNKNQALADKEQKIMELQQQINQTRQRSTAHQQELTHQQGKVSPFWLLLILPAVGVAVGLTYYYLKRKNAKSK